MHWGTEYRTTANEEQKELIDRITRIAAANTYNNEKAILSKIKELISDYQSQN